MDAKKEAAKKKETKAEQIERLEKSLTWHEQERIKCFEKKEKLSRMLDEGVKGLEQTYNLLMQMIAMQHGTGDDVNGFKLEIDYLKPEVLDKYTFESETAYNGDGQPESVTIKVMPKKGEETDL